MNKVLCVVAVFLALLGVIAMASPAGAGGTCIVVEDVPPPSDTIVCVPI